MPDPTPNPNHRFIAWQRVPPARKWTAVTGGQSEAEAYQALWALPFTGPARDVAVLPAGRDPNVKVNR